MRFLVLIALLIAMPLSAAVVSIHPLKFIVQDLAGEAVEVQTLMNNTHEFHHFQLRPSHLKAIHQAELALWLGPQAEPFLQTVFSQAQRQQKVLALEQLPDIIRLPVSDMDAEEEHDRDSHRWDNHLWLDTRNALEALKALKMLKNDELIEAYEAFDAYWAVELKQYQTRPFVVQHNALNYLVEKYSLNQIGWVAGHAGNPVGLKHLQALKQSVEASDARCYITFAGAQDKWGDAIFPATFKRTELDLFGVAPRYQTVWRGSYYLGFMNRILSELRDCLAFGQKGESLTE